MRHMLRAIVAALLGLLAKGVVRRYHPKVVMVTGSVGKTSTKDAVAAVLATGFFVRKSEKSYNSEFGVPFTIFGVENPWGNPLAWLRVLKAAISLLVLPNHYPNMLVLEVGADRPGDLAKILWIVKPDAVVVTRLPAVPVHVEAYATPEAVREEEFSPAYALSAGAPLVVAAEDHFAIEMAKRVSVRVISYGEAADADVRIQKIDFHRDAGMVAGMVATLATTEGRVEVVVKGSIGHAQLLCAAAALAIGREYAITPSEAVKALAEAFVPPPGRGRLLLGVHGSYLIDESYNSSPAAVEESLANLKAFPAKGRRIAVLGDMLELGRYSVDEHERIGARAAQAADIVIGVGVRAQKIVEAARAGGLSEEHAVAVENSRIAAELLPTLVRAGDVVLIKGSQSIRTERIVEALLLESAEVTKLVRQEREWKRR